MSVTITPTEERVRLWVREGRDRDPLSIVTRWLERAARRKGRHINVPSVTLTTDRDPALRKTHLYAWADSFPDTMPEWLRRAKPVVTRGADTVEKEWTNA